MYACLCRLQAAQSGDQCREISRPRGFEAKLLPAAGMFESEQKGMQRLTRERLNGRIGLHLRIRLGAGDGAGSPIGRVADQRVTEMRKVHADLMRAAGFEATFDQTCERSLGIAETLDDPVARARRLPAAAQHRHAFAIEGVASDVAFHKPLSQARGAPHHGVIGPLDGPMLELPGEAVHGTIILGGNKKAARVLVEPVHNSRPGLAAESAERGAAMRYQCVDQCAVGIAGGRMHNKTGGLVDDDEVVVFVNDRERNILRLRFCRDRRRQADFVGIPRFDPCVGVSYFFARARDVSGFDQLLQPRAADVGKARGEKLIEPLACVFGSGDRIEHGFADGDGRFV